MVVSFCWVLLFLFVPETFWDRTPRPRIRHTSKNNSRLSLFVHRFGSHAHFKSTMPNQVDVNGDAPLQTVVTAHSATESVVRQPPQAHWPTRSLHVGFAPDERDMNEGKSDAREDSNISAEEFAGPFATSGMSPLETPSGDVPHGTTSLAQHQLEDRVVPAGGVEPTPPLHNLNSPSYDDIERGQSDNFKKGRDLSNTNKDGGSSLIPERPLALYTSTLKTSPRLTFIQQLKPYNGRLHRDKWLRVAFRPFILYAYPAVLWSSAVYACSVGWLIVLSESVTVIYRSRTTYGFSALSTGLIYISPFIGGILGTAVAGKVSDIIVRAMSKRNGGLYEPEFRLVMAAPVTVATVIGLMGFGWSAKDHDAWIVPTIFFGIISFGCSLGSTTAITFCVDSYRQYAGEALVTLNFTKNIFHGLVFSLFFTTWLEDDGSKTVFIWLGVIQLILMAFTIPMYIFGKRARMWTVRRNFMEKF
jgi:hypothetical protein